MGRIRKTIELAKASWQILRQDRELVLLPLIAAVLSLMVAAVFIVPIALSADLGSTADGAEASLSGFQYFLLAVMSLILTTIAVYFKGALVAGAHERMSGGDPTVRSALGGATAKVHRLLPWALLTGTIGLVLQALRERAGFLGRIVVGMIGGAWEIVTFLVIPVIIIEDTGPIDSLKKSAELFKRTWGENLSAQVGFGLLGVVAAVPMILLIVIGAAIGSVGYVLAAAGVVGLIGVMLVVSALTAIFQTALYHYAVGQATQVAEAPGMAPGAGFDTNVLRDSFVRK